MKLLTWAHYALVAEDFQNVNVENAEAQLETGSEHLDDSSEQYWTALDSSEHLNSSEH